MIHLWQVFFYSAPWQIRFKDDEGMWIEEILWISVLLPAILVVACIKLQLYARATARHVLLESSAMFSDIVGWKLGLLIDGLLVSHLGAFMYWAYATYNEIQKQQQRRKKDK